MGGMPIFVPLLLLLAGLLGAAAVVLLVWRGRRGEGEKSGEALTLLQQQMAGAAVQLEQRLGQLTKTLNDQLAQGHQLSQQGQKLMNDRLEAAGKTIGELKGQLGQLGQATQNIAAVGTEVRKLQDILQSPKLRGSLGEWTLENLLAEVLPRQHYELQYRFGNGTIVDALVKLAQGSVAIDAKFPLSNFQAMLAAEDGEARGRLRRAFLKDVCRRIDEIAQKYILPDEGTLDFALMYVPAENVYYEAMMGEEKGVDVGAYGRGRKVICVSPNTLYAYLMVVATGLKGLQIEKNAQEIRRQLSRLTGEVGLLVNDFAVVSKHLGNAVSKHQEAGRKLDNLQMRVERMEDESDGESDQT